MRIINLLLIGILAVSASSFANDNQKGKVMPTQPKTSVQLWSVKDDVKADFKGTMVKLADMGFEGVEFAGDFGPFAEDGAALKAFLNSLGLQGSGAHIGFDALNDENFDKTVAFYQALGVDMLIVPWDERAWHPEGVKTLVKELNIIAKKLAPHGIKAGYHNHDQEFNDYKGATYWDYIAKNTGREVVLQLDVGWTNYASKDPIEYVKRYPNRTITTHYKIRTPKGSTDLSPIIGEDSFDWLALSKTNQTVGGTLWFVVEQEEYPNGLTPLQAVNKSKKGLDKLLKK